MYPEPILINLKAMEVNMGGFYAKGLVQFNYVRLWHLAKVEKNVVVGWSETVLKRVTYWHRWYFCVKTLQDI